MTATFVVLIDFLGTFAFAISGGLVAVRHRLDLFGVLVLSFAAATAGGIIRDVLLGLVPASVVDWRYLAVAVAAGLVTFWWHDVVERLRNPVQVSDAIGLSLFAVLGAGKALASGLGPTGAVMLGILSGVGGGILAIAPGKASIATWSPGLDDNGNSVLGMLALEQLSERMGWSVFG